MPSFQAFLPILKKKMPQTSSVPPKRKLCLRCVVIQALQEAIDELNDANRELPGCVECRAVVLMKRAMTLLEDHDL